MSDFVAIFIFIFVIALILMYIVSRIIELQEDIDKLKKRLDKTSKIK